MVKKIYWFSTGFLLGLIPFMSNFYHGSGKFGGEVLLFLLPTMIYICADTFKEFKREIKGD